MNKDKLDRLYRNASYLEAYTEHTNQRVQYDTEQAVGGFWDQLGQLQFQFLLEQGLKPHHRLLDIGCGTLRGGRHFINYLDAGCYHGFDLSEQAIAAAKGLVSAELLSDKCPTLYVNREKNLRFAESLGMQFDYLLAQSVFTHLMPDHVEECFAHIGSVMGPNSLFYFTYQDSENFKRNGYKQFSYPYSYFHDLAERHDFKLSDHSEDYSHPRSQRMLSLSR
ncbi:class I SAM-dependent DNA methyltransferase [Sphingorhabdus sp. SMR4y]|uniref:class I SAM-dependent DNA methyltransferase n=1 Tax=Sphingorhabdus sp. SMR4y TaxID=2584094 RepID=UPI000B5DFC34|nr:class I SAM-dependent methyltransferase [Sphingorhabdus sp. SMR4y]ASK88355.1 methyltransferase domain protein [Sphingorhabdus sp. SMR4y]